MAQCIETDLQTKQINTPVPSFKNSFETNEGGVNISIKEMFGRNLEIRLLWEGGGGGGILLIRLPHYMAQVVNGGCLIEKDS